MTEPTPEINLLDTLCVLCLKPNPDTMESMELAEKSYVSRRRAKVTTYTYPSLPFHKKCLTKFEIERWVVHPLLVATGVWILVMLIFGGFTAANVAEYGVPMIIFSLLLSFVYLNPTLGLAQKRFENKLEKWKAALYRPVLSPINQQTQEIPAREEEQSATEQAERQRVENVQSLHLRASSNDSSLLVGTEQESIQTEKESLRRCGSCEQEVHPIITGGRQYCPNCGITWVESREAAVLSGSEGQEIQPLFCRQCENVVSPSVIAGDLYCPDCGLRL